MHCHEILKTVYTGCISSPHSTHAFSRLTLSCLQDVRRSIHSLITAVCGRTVIKGLRPCTGRTATKSWKRNRGIIRRRTNPDPSLSTVNACSESLDFVKLNDESVFAVVAFAIPNRQLSADPFLRLTWTHENNADAWDATDGGAWCINPAAERPYRIFSQVYNTELSPYSFSSSVLSLVVIRYVEWGL